MTFLKGYWTYFTAIGGLIAAIGFFLHGDIGFDKLLEAILLVSGLFGLRRAVGTPAQQK